MKGKTMQAIRLQRRGVSENVEASLPSGGHLEIALHHGLGAFTYTISHEIDRGEDRPKGRDSRFQKLDCTDTADAIKQVSRRENLTFEPDIEAYMYSNRRAVEIWPYIATDVYWTCASYEPGTNTIRHEPSNVCLIVFRDGEACQYPDDPANRKYMVAIKDACDCYNGSVTAHGEGQERKEWAAWLLGEYIKDRHDGRPVKLTSIARS